MNHELVQVQIPDLTGLNKDLLMAGREARTSYLIQRPVSTGSSEIDRVLEGGLEGGNFYLFLGSAKNGKSTVLRCLGMTLAKSFPVLYVNFEQTGKNVYSKIYSLNFGRDFRTDIQTNPDVANKNIESLPGIPFYIAFWPEKLDEKSFNRQVRPCLKKSVEDIMAADPEHRKPVIILENLSDIYNERLHGNDNLVNIVTQTAQDVKNFAIEQDIAILLAHHTGKLQGDEPTLDDVRDSKRVVDLAHSIFCAYIRKVKDPIVGDRNRYMLKYVAGRGMSESVRWDVMVNGLSMMLAPLGSTPPPVSSKGPMK